MSDIDGKFLLIMLIAHCTGDFILQSKWMAQNKAKNPKALSLHVLTYTLTFALFYYIWLFDHDHKAIHSVFFGLTAPIIFILVNGFLHLITDFWTSKATSSYWKKSDFHNFFVVVGIDQLFHYVCIFYISQPITAWILNFLLTHNFV